MQENNIKKRKRFALFFKLGKNYGGAEQRLIRLFSSLYPDEENRVYILILDSGMDNNIKRKVKEWSSLNTSRIIYFKTLTKVFSFIKKNELLWICCSSHSFTTAFLFFASRIFSTKCLFASVESSASRLIFNSRVDRLRFLLTAYLSNAIDCLYPEATSILVKKFKNKQLSTTPGSFVNMNKFLIGDKKKIVLFASRLVNGKNSIMLLDAIHQIVNQFRQQGYKCIICGEGPLKNFLEEYSKKLEIKDCVEFTGVVDTNLYASQAKIFCSLQNVTNYPSQSLLEAMASGCWCIATNTGETHLIVNSSFGELIDTNAEALKNALLIAINLTEQRLHDASVAARNHVRDNYRIEQSIKHYQSILI